MKKIFLVLTSNLFLAFVWLLSGIHCAIYSTHVPKVSFDYGLCCGLFFFALYEASGYFTDFIFERRKKHDSAKNKEN